MKTITNPIIPLKQTFAKSKTHHAPNYEAICVFTAIGFFLDQDTFWKNEMVLKPATTYQLDASNFVVKSAPNFSWHHEPRDINFNAAVDEFTDLFESIVKDQSGEKTVLLPLSGGLDSRTQAVALQHTGAHVNAYSYSFKDGFKEHLIGEKIAEACDFKFDSMLIPPNYLWHVIEDMADINQCYSDFTHPRQMAFLEYFKQMQGEFSLGHWGDVLFDRGFAAADENYSDIEIIYKKLIKKGGLELASKLWESWNLDGNFESYLKQRIEGLLDNIDINNKSAKIRAFKSMYWAPRWTSVSLGFFEAAHPVNLPYYDDRMCQFICGIPEDYLADRKIQIEYIKNRSPKLAAIEWQDHMPYNLYNYNQPQFAKSLSYRIKHKMQREIDSLMGKKYIQRNWELQFLGKTNETYLEQCLFDEKFISFVGEDTVKDIYHKFKTDDQVYYSHAVSMLLTLSFKFKQLKDSLL